MSGQGGCFFYNAFPIFDRTQCRRFLQPIKENVPIGLRRANRVNRLPLDFPWPCERPCGVPKTVRSKRARASTPALPKRAAYEALSSMNQHFEDVLAALDRLRQIGLFDSTFLGNSERAMQAKLEETRSWINFEITECLRDREERDRLSFGRTYERWERSFEDPEGVRVEADPRKRNDVARNVRVRSQGEPRGSRS